MAITDWVQANNIFELFCYLISSSWVLELFVWAVCPDATTTTTTQQLSLIILFMSLDATCEIRVWKSSLGIWQTGHSSIYAYSSKLWLQGDLAYSLGGWVWGQEHCFQGQEKAGKIWHLLMWSCACSFSILGYACLLLIILHCKWVFKSSLTELNKPVRSSYY